MTQPSELARRVDCGPEGCEIDWLASPRIDVDDDPVRCRAGRVGDLDGLEVSEILQPPLGALDQGAVVGVAFR